MRPNLEIGRLIYRPNFTQSPFRIQTNPNNYFPKYIAPNNNQYHVSFLLNSKQNSDLNIKVAFFDKVILSSKKTLHMFYEIEASQFTLCFLR